jgi:hypothetical protein
MTGVLSADKHHVNVAFKKNVNELLLNRNKKGYGITFIREPTKTIFQRYGVALLLEVWS